jgi:lipoate-protein ligase A
MLLHDLGHVSWLDSQLLYHAQPRVGQEALNILAPREPYVCIGYHQDLEQEVDLAYCRERGVPVFRREVGGGAVFLDGRQLFFQLVLSRNNPLAQGDKAAFYRRLLEPVALAYGDLGVPARYRPVNDLVTAEGRKISGTGAAEIGDFLVLVGNLIADFDYETMARVLRVPDQKYRDKVFQSMRQNLTTLRRETGREFSLEQMAQVLVRRFSEVLGPLESAAVPAAVRAEADALAPRFLAEEWLFKKGKSLPQGRAVRIAGGVEVLERVHKAPGGLLRVTLEVRDGRLGQVSLSGDFFCYPREAVGELEQRLAGAALEEVPAVLQAFYAGGVETPGVAIADWLAVLGAGERSRG